MRLTNDRSNDLPSLGIDDAGSGQCLRQAFSGDFLTCQSQETCLSAVAEVGPDDRGIVGT